MLPIDLPDLQLPSPPNMWVKFQRDHHYLHSRFWSQKREQLYFFRMKKVDHLSKMRYPIVYETRYIYTFSQLEKFFPEKATHSPRCAPDRQDIYIAGVRPKRI